MHSHTLGLHWDLALWHGSRRHHSWHHHWLWNASGANGSLGGHALLSTHGLDGHSSRWHGSRRHHPWGHHSIWLSWRRHVRLLHAIRCHWHAHGRHGSRWRHSWSANGWRKHATWLGSCLRNDCWNNRCLRWSKVRLSMIGSSRLCCSGPRSSSSGWASCCCDR